MMVTKRNIIAVLLLIQTMIGGSSMCYAQKDPDAVQAALSILLHRHSVNADTIAVEISNHFYKSAPMQTAIARAYYRNNERVKTRAYLAKAMKADDKYTPAYILYGDMYGEWDVDSATYWFDKAIKANPKEPDAYVRYANVISRRDMELAKAKLEELRKEVPSYNVDVELAAIYNKKGDDKAAAEAMASVDLNTLSMNQIAQYLQNCYWSKNDERGMEVARVATERFADNRGFNRVYAWCAARAGFHSIALEEGEKWMNSAPKDSINSIDYLTMGNAYLADGKIEKAFDMWREIQSLKDDYFAPQMKGQISAIVSNRVENLKSDGRFDDAVDVYRAFMTEYPSETDPAYQYYVLSQIYRDQQDELNGEEKKSAISKMFTIYREIEAKFPTWSNIHFVLYTHARWTYAYFDQNNEEQLAEPYYQKLYDYLYEKGNDINEQQTNMMVECCQYMASTAYFQRKDVKTARQWWARILKYDPENENAKNALAKIKK